MWQKQKSKPFTWHTSQSNSALRAILSPLYDAPKPTRYTGGCFLRDLMSLYFRGYAIWQSIAFKKDNTRALCTWITWGGFLTCRLLDIIQDLQESLEEGPGNLHFKLVSLVILMHISIWELLTGNKEMRKEATRNPCWEYSY